MELMLIVTSDLKLATLHELQTKYSVVDLYDMLEIQEAYTALTKEATEKDKKP